MAGIRHKVVLVGDPAAVVWFRSTLFGPGNLGHNGTTTIRRLPIGSTEIVFHVSIFAATSHVQRLVLRNASAVIFVCSRGASWQHSENALKTWMALAGEDAVIAVGLPRGEVRSEAQRSMRGVSHWSELSSSAACERLLETIVFECACREDSLLGHAAVDAWQHSVRSVYDTLQSRRCIPCFTTMTSPRLSFHDMLSALPPAVGLRVVSHIIPSPWHLSPDFPITLGEPAVASSWCQGASRDGQHVEHAVSVISIHVVSRIAQWVMLSEIDEVDVHTIQGNTLLVLYHGLQSSLLQLLLHGDGDNFFNICPLDATTRRCTGTAIFEALKARTLSGTVLPKPPSLADLCSALDTGCQRAMALHATTLERSLMSFVPQRPSLDTCGATDVFLDCVRDAVAMLPLAQWGDCAVPAGVSAVCELVHRCMSDAHDLDLPAWSGRQPVGPAGASEAMEKLLRCAVAINRCERYLEGIRSLAVDRCSEKYQTTLDACHSNTLSLAKTVASVALPMGLPTRLRSIVERGTLEELLASLDKVLQCASLGTSEAFCVALRDEIALLVATTYAVDILRYPHPFPACEFPACIRTLKTGSVEADVARILQVARTPAVKVQIQHFLALVAECLLCSKDCLTGVCEAMTVRLGCSPTFIRLCLTSRGDVDPMDFHLLVDRACASGGLSLASLAMASFTRLQRSAVGELVRLHAAMDAHADMLCLDKPTAFARFAWYLRRLPLHLGLRLVAGLLPTSPVVLPGNDNAASKMLSSFATIHSRFTAQEKKMNAMAMKAVAVQTSERLHSAGVCQGQLKEIALKIHDVLTRAHEEGRLPWPAYACLLSYTKRARLVHIFLSRTTSAGFSSIDGTFGKWNALPPS